MKDSRTKPEVWELQIGTLNLFGIWNLGFGICLGFGISNFGVRSIDVLMGKDQARRRWKRGLKTTAAPTNIIPSAAELWPPFGSPSPRGTYRETRGFIVICSTLGPRGHRSTIRFGTIGWYGDLLALVVVKPLHHRRRVGGVKIASQAR